MEGTNSGRGYWFRNPSNEILCWTARESVRYIENNTSIDTVSHYAIADFLLFGHTVATRLGDIRVLPRTKQFSFFVAALRFLQFPFFFRTRRLFLLLVITFAIVEIGIKSIDASRRIFVRFSETLVARCVVLVGPGVVIPKRSVIVQGLAHECAHALASSRAALASRRNRRHDCACGCGYE